MLPRKNRLTKKEIAELKGKRLPVIQGKFFGLLYQPQAQEKKFALIISNKIARKAVLRNAVKRRLFLAIRESLFDKEGKFLFLAKKGSLQASLEDIIKELVKMRKRIG